MRLLLEGRKFGKLTAIEYVGNSKWKCVCDCGKVTVTETWCLTTGHTKSCGCYKIEITSQTNSTHRQSNSRLYRIWRAMKGRCNNPNHHDYSFYGGRGIRVCQDWQSNFELFEKWSREHGYSDELTIDRIDNYKGYSPENCRWVDRKEQARNMRSTRLITYNGETKTSADWGVICGVSGRSIRNRIDHGWSIEQALTTPKSQGKKVVKRWNRQGRCLQLRT